MAVAAMLAVTADCIRRGDLDGAAAVLSRAADLARGDERAEAFARGPPPTVDARGECPSIP